MKTKVCKWGNSHGIRIAGHLMDHLNVEPGDDIDIKLTEKGAEIIKNARSQGYVMTLTQETIDGILATTEAVKTIDDPYAESGIGYLVITINPCNPILREVPIETPGAYRTLIDAKEAARQLLQNTIAEAKTSLAELRQVGIENISYIAL